MENFEEGKLIETNAVQKLLSLMKESAYSHLMEVKTVYSFQYCLFSDIF